MTIRSKKIFLFACVVVPFLLYCIYYYGMILKNAPYKFSEFESIQFQYGYGDTLRNKYDSRTGDYQYVNKRDSLIKMKLILSKNELLYLHRKAADLGFWDFPANELNPKVKGRVPRFVTQFNYQHKSKKVVYDASYDGPESLVDANERLIKEFQKVLNEAEARQKK
ncbi:hypothetical protein EWM62_02690 [Mucilaginibacter terrigena]|uniref:Uncharacterized protein n=1 Tax=Mucilaginibacter terrigena TaxID=2492395 RepID=A0A4Q5LS64_9SPHI|nr:hypothetical protein [Mucilaginibacter terrigena]RYU92362.1 hypothetical protein EWM62_02690 [Mucilaginibacter terrigena]